MSLNVTMSGASEQHRCRSWSTVTSSAHIAERLLKSLTFRHFPLREVHPHAQHAAEVSEAANSEGKFWAMHDKLFENQEALDDASLVRHAAEISVDAGRVARELDSHQHASQVAEDYMSGLKSGVNGTPTFYMDGTRYTTGPSHCATCSPPSGINTSNSKSLAGLRRSRESLVSIGPALRAHGEPRTKLSRRSGVVAEALHLA